MGVARQVANHSDILVVERDKKKLTVIMRKAILALLVISAVTLLASADKPSSVESKPVKTVPSKVSKPVTKVVKSEAKEPKAPSVSTRQQKKYPLKPIPRKYPIHPSQFKNSRLHRLAKKFPVHKVLSNSVRQSRKFNAGPSKKVVHGPAKKVQKIQRRKRIQKPVGQHKAHARVRHQEKTSHNFARFLRAFGKQLNRPVFPRFAKKAPKIANNRRKFKIAPGKNHPIVFKKAEDIAGYEKFTLDEVVFPVAKSDDQVKEASDRVDNIEPIFVDDINKVEDEKNKVEDSKKEDTKSAQKFDVDPRIKKLDVR